MNSGELDELVGKVQRGDRDAFTLLVHDVTPELRRFLSARASSVDMVEELVQATLVTAYQHLGSYRPEGTFLAWLKGIGRNLMLKEVQRRERAPAADSDLLDRLALEAALPPETGDEEEEAANLDRLRRCLEKLPEPAWQIVQLRYFEKQSIREIAAATGRTETAVAVNLFRIRQDLRDCMLGGTGHE